MAYPYAGRPVSFAHSNGGYYGGRTLYAGNTPYIPGGSLPIDAYGHRGYQGYPVISVPPSPYPMATQLPHYGYQTSPVYPITSAGYHASLDATGSCHSPLTRASFSTTNSQRPTLSEVAAAATVTIIATARSEKASYGSLGCTIAVRGIYDTSILEPATPPIGVVGQSIGSSYKFLARRSFVTRLLTRLEVRCIQRL